MNTEITYKLANSDDYAGVIALYNRGFDARRSVSDLQWLYDDNPMGKGQLFIAKMGNEVIGMQGVVRYQFRYLGKIIGTYKSEDSLINADYRGKGIYKTLYKMVFDHIGSDLIWGLTDKRTILDRTGMPSTYRFIKSAMVNGRVGPSLFEDNHNQYLKSIIYSVNGVLNKLKKKKADSDTDFHTEQTDEFIKLETFGKRLSDDYQNDMIPLLSDQVITWRLGSNPKVKDWKVYVLNDKQGEIRGLSLVSINGKKCRWLASYFTNDVDEQSRTIHIRSVTDDLFSKDIKIIEQWLFDNSQQARRNKKMMMSIGFKKIKSGLWVVNNGHFAEYSVDDILFSGQLGLD